MGYKTNGSNDTKYFISGQMLLNWFISSTSDSSYLKHKLNSQDLRLLGIQYCTHLLAAGVLRQITDKNAPTEVTFKVCLILLLQSL